MSDNNYRNVRCRDFTLYFTLIRFTIFKFTFYHFSRSFTLHSVLVWCLCHFLMMWLMWLVSCLPVFTSSIYSPLQVYSELPWLLTVDCRVILSLSQAWLVVLSLLSNVPKYDNIIINFEIHHADLSQINILVNLW